MLLLVGHSVGLVRKILAGKVLEGRPDHPWLLSWSDGDPWAGASHLRLTVGISWHGRVGWRQTQGFVRPVQVSPVRLRVKT